MLYTDIKATFLQMKSYNNNNIQKTLLTMLYFPLSLKIHIYTFLFLHSASLPPLESESTSVSDCFFM